MSRIKCAIFFIKKELKNKACQDFGYGPAESLNVSLTMNLMFMWSDLGIEKAMNQDWWKPIHSLLHVVLWLHNKD